VYYCPAQFVRCVVVRDYRTMKSSSSKRVKGSRKNKTQAFSKAMSNAGDVIVKRLTLPALTLATGAGTSIPVTVYKSGDVQSVSATEWASFAARYQQFRVRAIRVRGKATQPVQLATVAHSTLYQGDFIGSSTPSTAVQIFSDEHVKETATYKDFTYVATWSRNPNAKLWNPTASTPASANQFAIAVASPATPALTTATTYYAVTEEWEVEFRGSQ
jgi:hypothetical protein